MSSRDSPSNNDPQHAASQSTALTPLQAAMHVADIIRQQVAASEDAGILVKKNHNLAKTQQQQEAGFPSSALSFLSHTPGLVEGLAAGSLFLIGFIPVRRVFLGAVGKGLGELPNFFITASQLIMSADVGLLTCSLVGGRHYLHSLSQVSSTAISPTADSICAHPLVHALTQHEEPLPLLSSDRAASDYSSSSSTSSIVPAAYDPRVLLADDLRKALHTCRRRAEAKRHDEPP